MGSHALLSPSSSGRWLTCTPSARLEERMPDVESDAAKEGTLAHSIAEQKLLKYIARGRKKIECVDPEMDRLTDDYKDYVVEIFNKERKQTKDAKLLVEETLDITRWVPKSKGTGDAVIVGDDTLHVIDLKYGRGVPVPVEGNTQTRLYAAGAIEAYGLLYGFKTVTVHIYQPRVENGIAEATYNVDELVKWMDEYVHPRALLAYDGAGEAVPGDHCKFCNVKGSCKARAALEFEKAEREERLDAMLMNEDEMSKVLHYTAELAAWCKDVEEFALQQMLTGVHYEGFKLVEGTSRRKVIDEKLLVDKLMAAGIEEAMLYEKKLVGMTKLEKIAGKKELPLIAGESIIKPKGKPAIAPMSDKRPEYQSSDPKDAFKEIEVVLD